MPNEFLTTPVRGGRKLKQFYKWCIEERGTSEKTCAGYTRYLERPLNPRNRHSVVAYRLWYIFQGKEPPKELRVPQSRPDKKVPSLDDVRKTLGMIDNPKVLLAYKVMLQTGLRLEHTVYLLNNIDNLNIVKLGDYYRVDLNLVRAKKKAWVAYLLETPEKTSIKSNTISNYAKRLPVKPKYIRKFVITMMHRVKIENNVVKFIVGHTQTGVHELSYYDMLADADEQYKKYADWLRGEGLA